MSHRVFVLGAGRAGLGLARAFRDAGVGVVGVHGRHPSATGDPVSVGELPESLARATVVLIAVRDAQIDQALAELAGARMAPDAIVLHASGSAEPAGFAPLRARGHPAGTFHPLLPLSDPTRAADVLRGGWIGIDGDEGAREAGRNLAAALGARTLDIPAGEKARYHAAAVIASNFPAVMLTTAERVLVGAGIAPDAAREAIRPLFMAAAENLRYQEGAASLTGPIVRGDVDTIRSHIAALRSDPQALDVYRALSRAAVELAREAGTDPAALAAMAQALAPPRLATGAGTAG